MKTPEPTRDQMESKRKAFRVLWETRLVPRLNFMRVKQCDYGKYEDIAWQTWIAVKKDE